MATHAFAVLAHTDPAMVERLVSVMSPHGPVHLHVNAAVDPAPFAGARAHADVVVPSMAVRWGGWSLTEATLRLAASALTDPEVQQVTWLSGAHYPLQHPADLAAQIGRDHLRLHPAPQAALGKPEWRFRTRFVDRFPPGTRAAVLANGLSRRLLPPLRYEAALAPHVLYAGTAWWSLTRRTLEDMLEWIEANPRARAYFSRIAIPDESLFHTAVAAVLTERARTEGADPQAALDGLGRSTTFVRWSTGRHPIPLDAASVRAAAADGWWFARKFESARPDLLDVAEEGWGRRRGSASPQEDAEPRRDAVPGSTGDLRWSPRAT